MNGKTRVNVVNIHNNKGTKIIEEKKGSKTTRKQKVLSKKEIKKIRANQFIPGLFNMRPNNKTRRR
jgi:hypothetical protein